MSIFSSTFTDSVDVVAESVSLCDLMLESRDVWNLLIEKAFKHAQLTARKVRKNGSIPLTAINLRTNE
jgi:hypothetical protein